MRKPSVTKVVDLAVARTGSLKLLAKRLGISRQAIQQWRDKDDLPIKHVRTIEEITGISRHVLRHDIFGDAPASETKKAKTNELCVNQ